jgi:hypothetical protein
VDPIGRYNIGNPPASKRNTDNLNQKAMNIILRSVETATTPTRKPPMTLQEVEDRIRHIRAIVREEISGHSSPNTTEEWAEITRFALES